MMMYLNETNIKLYLLHNEVYCTVYTVDSIRIHPDILGRYRYLSETLESTNLDSAELPGAAPEGCWQNRDLKNLEVEFFGCRINCQN